MSAPSPHWHLWAGMPGYLPHRGPEFAGWDAEQAIDALVADLEQVECACADQAANTEWPTGDPDDELCEACLTVAVTKSARADRDHRLGFGVTLFHEVWEVAPAPPDCACYEDEFTE
jgi:hypothetical protein